MTDLSTYAGQVAHYAAVQARLGKTPGAMVVSRLAIPAVISRPVLPPPKPKKLRLKVWPYQPEPAPYDHFAPEVVPPKPTWRNIINSVARKHGVSFREVIGESRFTNIMDARREACWRLRRGTSMSLPEIGRRLGGKDHTTVLHSLRRYAQLIEQGKADA